ncbi:MAG: nicotinate (nicotinamide) nucleotide adenylyltransferase [Bacteroidales bacterium]|nr:nicotinate (nicotinamide) nucleotide adenylyltransferase [Bacteroidales bacterium]
MKIAVYSGSFNPLHIGHQAIMEYFSADKSYDGMYLVVSPQNPLKMAQAQPDGQERYLNAVAALKRHPELKVKPDDIELGMEAPHYTIRTLDALKQREPKNSFTLVMGADNLANIRRWRDYRRILLEYGVAVYPRQGVDLTAVREELMKECPDYRIQLTDAPMVDISSTEIRDGIAAGRDMSEYLM